MSDDRAKRRFFIIQALRWSGLALVLVGLAATRGRMPLPESAGYALVIIGLVDALILPSVLARRWKSPSP